ncbi:unnamed protein product, partial [Rotaria sordida]
QLPSSSIPIDLSNSRTTIKIEENSSSYNSILQTQPLQQLSYL